MSCEAGAVRTAACPKSQPGSRGQPFCRCGAARSGALHQELSARRRSGDAVARRACPALGRLRDQSRERPKQTRAR